MSRPVSLAARAALNAAETGDAFLVLLTASAIGCLLAWGRSDNTATRRKLQSREVSVEP